MHGMQAQCELGDRRACNAAEFEGPNLAAAAPATWSPEAALAWALLPLLLALASSMWRRLWRARSQSKTAVLRGRRLETAGPRAPSSAAPHIPPAQLGAPQHEHQRCAAQQAPRPPHPAVQPARVVPGLRSPTSASLLAAADTAASFLLLPLSVLQTATHLALGRGGRAGAATPRTPEGAAGASPGQAGGSGGGRGMHYGLGYGEAESEEDEWGAEGGESELTQTAVRRLQQSGEYQAFLQARGLSPADVSASARKLRLYRRLRRLDPGAFWALLSPGSRAAFDSRPPSRLRLAADYLLSTGSNLAAAAAAVYLYQAPLPPTAKAAAAAAAALWGPPAQWRRARPTTGALLGLWYEELQWGHAAPSWRCAAAAVVELAYITGSAGIGLGVSLALRLSARRQSVGELLAGVRAVHEVLTAAPRGGGDGE